MRRPLELNLAQLLVLIQCLCLALSLALGLIQSELRTHFG